MLRKFRFGVLGSLLAAFTTNISTQALTEGQARCLEILRNHAYAATDALRPDLSTTADWPSTISLSQLASTYHAKIQKLAQATSDWTKIEDAVSPSVHQENLHQSFYFGYLQQTPAAEHLTLACGRVELSPVTPNKARLATVPRCVDSKPIQVSVRALSLYGVFWIGGLSHQRSAPGKSQGPLTPKNLLDQVLLPLHTGNFWELEIANTLFHWQRTAFFHLISSERIDPAGANPPTYVPWNFVNPEGRVSLDPTPPDFLSQFQRDPQALAERVSADKGMRLGTKTWKEEDTARLKALLPWMRGKRLIAFVRSSSENIFSLAEFALNEFTAAADPQLTLTHHASGKQFAISLTEWIELLKVAELAKPAQVFVRPE